MLLVWLSGCPCLVTPIRVDEDDEGRTVCARVGATLIVTLGSNASTGYRWELAGMDAAILEHTASTYVPPVIVIPGATGTERWEFTAVAPGTTTLQLAYRRPSEPPATEPADSFQIDVTVISCPF